MKNFELKEWCTVGNTKMQVFECQNRVHFIEMTKEDALSRGVLDRWADGGIMSLHIGRVIQSKERIDIPNPGRRPKKKILSGWTIVCDTCGISERMMPLSNGDPFIHEVRLR